MRKTHRKTMAFLLCTMLFLIAAVSPVIYTAAQDTGFSDTMQETPEIEMPDTMVTRGESEPMPADVDVPQEEVTAESMENENQTEETTEENLLTENTENTAPEQDIVIDSDEYFFTDGTDRTPEAEEGFISSTEEIELETESELESGELLMMNAPARNVALMAANSDSSAWFATANELLTSYDTNNSHPSREKSFISDRTVPVQPFLLFLYIYRQRRNHRPLSL